MLPPSALPTTAEVESRTYRGGRWHEVGRGNRSKDKPLGTGGTGVMRWTEVIEARARGDEVSMGYRSKDKLGGTQDGRSKQEVI